MKCLVALVLLVVFVGCDMNGNGCFGGDVVESEQTVIGRLLEISTEIDCAYSLIESDQWFTVDEIRESKTATSEGLAALFVYLVREEFFTPGLICFVVTQENQEMVCAMVNVSGTEYWYGLGGEIVRHVIGTMSLEQYEYIARND